jgi:hypothetical protein
LAEADSTLAGGDAPLADFLNETCNPSEGCRVLSANTAIVRDLMQKTEHAMDTFADLSYNARRAICLALAAIIVSAGMGLTAVGVNSMIDNATQAVAMR